MSNKRSWQIHINGITVRANKMLGLIRHNLRGTSQKLRQQAYISQVHPHLEYCCTIWNPYTRKEVTRIKNIQHHAARFVSNNYGQQESVSAVINNLHWDTLEKRRQTSCLLLIYRIHTQQTAINCNRYLAPVLPNSTRLLPPKQISNHPSSHPGVQQLLFPTHGQLVEHPPWERVGSPNPRGLQRNCYHTVTNLSYDLCFYSHSVHTLLAPYTYFYLHLHIRHSTCIYTHWRLNPDLWTLPINNVEVETVK